MPLSYGGGLRDLDDIKAIFSLGVEKVIINSYAVENPHFISDVSKLYGTQSIVVAMDVRRNSAGECEIFTQSGRKKTGLHPVQHAMEMERLGAGEIFLNSIDRDGTTEGYDIDLIKKVTESLSIPVIACGGAGRISDFVDVVKNAGASAGAAGSLFFFHGKHKAVLINYPEKEELARLFA
jgi:cyclase